MKVPIIDIHTHKDLSGDISIKSFRAGIESIDRNIKYSAAVHPWDAYDINDFDLTSLVSPDLMAIGECGLDYAISETSRKAQKRWFDASLDFAAQLDIPVIIHCVKAYDDIINVLKRSDLNVIIHGFNGHSQLAERLLNEGYYISFGEALFKSPKTQDTLKNTPTDRIFLETDISEIPICDIYTKASDIIGCTETILAESIFTNYKRLFE